MTTIEKSARRTSKPTKDEIRALVESLAPGYGLDPLIIMKQIQTESAFDSEAYNKGSKATGLMQLTPIAVKDLKLRFGMEVDPANWRQNVTGGMAMMCYLKRHFGDYGLALAAFNWGEGNVAKLLKANPHDWRYHLPAETTGYLNKIIGKPLEHQEEA